MPEVEVDKYASSPQGVVTRGTICDLFLASTGLETGASKLPGRACTMSSRPIPYGITSSKIGTVKRSRKRLI